MVLEFSLLQSSAEERSRRWKSFWVGFVLQGLGLAVVLSLAALFPVRPEESRQNLWSAKVTLLTPALPKPSLPVPKLQLPPKQIVETPKIIEPKPIAPPVVARVRIPVPEPPKLQPVSPRTDAVHPTLPKWQPKVQVGAFKDTAPAVATLKTPASKVQTGGFGSSSGVPGLAQSGSHPNVAHLGAFDTPAGPGSGNGTGGNQGARGTVSSAGFGDGAVAAAPQGVPRGGRVASAGFGDGAASAPAQGTQDGGRVAAAGFADAQSMTHGASQAPIQQAAVTDPVEIVSKPNPVYTEEARKLHIQGEVLLRVVFGASGRLQILGVARGLGHGLDEAAIRAAQQIEFKPARRNGQPVDTTATLHILFELAA